MKKGFPEPRTQRSFPVGGTQGEQAEAEAVEPWRADAGGSQSVSRETPDRKRCTRPGGRRLSAAGQPCGATSRWVQPPDTENRTSGGVGGCRGSSPAPDPIVKARRGRMLGNVLMRIRFGEIGSVWYFLFCWLRWVACLLAGRRGGDDGRLPGIVFLGAGYLGAVVFWQVFWHGAFWRWAGWHGISV